MDPLIYLCDLFVFNLALLLAFKERYPELSGNRTFQIFFLVTNLSWICACQLSKNYVIDRPLDLWSTMNKFLIAIMYQLLLVLGAFYLLKVNIGGFEIVIYNVLFFFLAFIQRSTVFFVLDYIRQRGYNIRRVSLMGDAEITARIKVAFKKHSEYGYEIVHSISESELESLSVQNLVQALRAKMVNEVFICYKQIDNAFVKSLITECDLYHIHVKLVSDLLIDNNGAKLINYNGIPVMALSSREEKELSIRMIKRSFDVLFSVTMMIAGFPLFAILVALTKATSKGPVFYRQQRIGFDEKPFFIYKFRSMHTNSEKFGPQLSSENDVRITRWGKVMRKTRLDELPQFWNVFKGDMSIVGPRPERQYFIEQIIKRAPDYRKLLRVKPGITSLGQVHYGYAENVDQMCDRMTYDLQYLGNFNINRDLNIILRTVKVMIQAKGK